MKQWSWTWKITEQQEGMLVRDYLGSVRAFSRQLLKQIKQSQGLRVNGADVTVRKVLHAGDRVEVALPIVKPAERLEPVALELVIVYEDDDLLILDKPAGLAVMPSMNHDVTLANGIIAYYEKHGVPSTVHIVTRLDKDTSGLVLVAKHAYSHSLLSRGYIGPIEKTYWALVEGHLINKEGMIDVPIGRKEGSIIEREIREDGQPAVTRYHVLRPLHAHSLVELELLTGRTHQIRIHMRHMGHPLAGDDLYGGSLSIMKRQALHCRRLTFPHPITGEVVSCEAELPADIKRAIGDA
ncbi:pseudouridine synthase [Thalassobacillus devorans]|uniref:Pseudouridine synthase n=1 Tax=Thalassobacillus devorans TaxID=279813 RepID=A0ABQ1NF56_9BACI|nr:RluA family pseudouridine synthase [Thalassobacillus devorans]NIK27090.1 23S rRNA pseudouridine1911/1915/1917 synthase [Thalassobacillus devorans]GGC74857.1 pseudouridine synthase [Thalassobacillus devorans]